MPEDARVQHLVEAALEGSRTPEEVCADCPEFLPAVVRRLRQIQGLNVDLQNLFPADVLATPDTSDPEPNLPGLPAIPGYDILGVLGRGGMGVVYKARQNKLDRLVALKMILAGSHAGPAELARFQTEWEAIARLQHPNIVQVHEVGEHEGKPFFSLEFCGGGSLDKKLHGTPLLAGEAAALVETLARAMQAAHDKDVIHRDLKPANVLLTETGTPKITDFGLARKVDEVGQTRSGDIMGTPSYMAPEQASGKSKEIGPATDVYALGAILYECLTGRPPFKAATALETIMQVMVDEPVPPSQLQTKMPRDLETICLKCLRKEAEKRYSSAEALAEDLTRFQRGEPIVARPVGGLERGIKWVRRNPVVSALAAAVLLVLTAGVVVSGWFAVVAGREALTARGAEKKAEDRAEAAAAAKNQAEGEKNRADGQARAARNAEKTAGVEAESARQAKKTAEESAKAEAKARQRAEEMVHAGKLELAQEAFAVGNGAVALQHLEACQWNLRGWEHHYLWTRFNAKQTMLGHLDSVTSVTFSPDGKRIVTGSSDNTTKVWDAEKGQEILSLKGHTDSVRSVAFSPDGKRLLTGSADKTAKVWDAKTGQEIFTIKGHTNDVSSVAYSPDGKRLLTGSGDKTVRLLNAEKSQEVLTLKGHTGLVLSVAFSPDGKRLLTGTSGQDIQGRLLPGEAKVWDAKNGQLILTLKGHTSGVTSMAFSPNGKRILTGAGGFDNQGRLLPGEAKVWDADKGQERFSFKGHTGPVTSVAFSPDGRRFLTGSYDTTAKVWDADNGQEVFSLKGHTDSVRSVAFSPDGKRLFAWDRQRKVLAWSAEDGKPVEPDDPPVAPLPGTACSPDGSRLALMNLHTVTVIDTTHHERQNLWPLPDAGERQRYHTELAGLAEKDKQWFAAAFHLNRLLLDTPDDVELQRRRGEALRCSAAVVLPIRPSPMEKAP